MKYTVIILLLLGSSIYASSIYPLVEYQKAYNKGTRNFNGTPGQGYWQNSTDYDLKVSFEPKSGDINGSGTMQYFNNSPDTLKSIQFRLLHNLYKSGAARDIEVEKEDLFDGVMIKQLKINGALINMDDVKQAIHDKSNLIIPLRNSPIKPRSTTSIEIEWQTKLPKKTRLRIGTYGDSTFFLGYFYPQIAVYDDLNGWDRTYYNGVSEFYQDFSNFKISLTLPAEYMVWGTGELQNSAEIYPEYVQKRLQIAKNSDSVISIVSATEANELRAINVGKESKTWIFNSKQVPDIAYGISSFYAWDATSAVTDSSKKSRILVHSCYNPGSLDFYEVADLAKKSIEYFSHTLPGVPFPFPQQTVFNGNEGTEFPMIINDGSFEQRFMSVYVTSHEIAHQYFPFYVGSNEQLNAWIDEGMAVFLPYELQLALEPSFNFVSRNMDNFGILGSRRQHVSLSESTYKLRKPEYDYTAYAHGSIAIYMLRETMGRDKFNKTLQKFIKTWAYKHPTHYDFVYFFSREMGESATSIVTPWFMESGIADLSINKAKQNGKEIELTIEKLGRFPIATEVTLTDASGNTEKTMIPITAWGDKKEAVVKVKTQLKVVKVTLGGLYFPDSDKSNNVLEL